LTRAVRFSEEEIAFAWQLVNALSRAAYQARSLLHILEQCVIFSLSSSSFNSLSVMELSFRSCTVELYVKLGPVHYEVPNTGPLLPSRLRVAALAAG
jgi:hypothetical protein